MLSMEGKGSGANLESDASLQSEHLMKMISRISIGNGGSQEPSVAEELIRSSTNRNDLIVEHIQYARETGRNGGGSGGGLQYSSTISSGYQPTSFVEYTPENRVEISDLCKSIGKVMLGKYLVCRTLVWPYRLNALQTVVEDQAGEKGVVLSLYNYSLDEEFDPYALPRGIPLIIKNPWLKLTGSGHLGLRCDNPAEVTVFPGSFWEPLDFRLNALCGENGPDFYVDWRTRGNDYFRRKKPYNAIRSFTSGLQQNPIDAALFSNRSAAFLNVGRPNFALADAEAALKLEPNNVKAMWRKAVALCRIKKHKEAIRFLNKMISEVENGRGKELQDLLRKIDNVWETGRLGKHYLDEAKKIPPGTYLNYVEYKGPVRVSKVEGKGRGLLATREIKFGELIIASRAFDIATHDYKTDFSNDLNVSAQIYKTPACNRLISSIANRLMTQPELRKELYQLSAGTELGHIEPKKGDMGLLVDMQRVEGICLINAFGTNGRDPEGNEYSGIWILPSFINHSCVDNNATWHVYGDFIFVIALTKIKKGEEITMPYFNALAEDSFQKCQQILSKYEFSCDCRLCQMGDDGPKNFVI